MTNGLQGSSAGLSKYLDKREILDATVDQLRKDLALGQDQLGTPPLGDETFELLRTQVQPALEELRSKSMHALQVAMYRVDIPEKHMVRTIAAGGLAALAGETVLRCLQKVLTRLRYAGRY